MSFGRAHSDRREGPSGGASGLGGQVRRRSLFPGPIWHRGSVRFVLGFVAGCATVPWAAYLSFRDAHPPLSAGAYYGLDIAAEVGVCALGTLPVSGVVLALMQLQRAFSVASAGWALSMMFSILLSMVVQGGALPAWVYGLCSGLCYGAAALLSVSPAGSSRAQPAATIATTADADAAQLERLPHVSARAALVHIRVHDADADADGRRPESASGAYEAGEPGS